MKAPSSQAEQDVEEMLQSFRDSFAKTKSEAGAGAKAPPPPPPQTAKPNMSGSTGGAGSKWGDLKASGSKDSLGVATKDDKSKDDEYDSFFPKETKTAVPAPAPAKPAYASPPPATPRPYSPPPVTSAPQSPPPPSVVGASSAGSSKSKWGALKEGVKEPTNAIERAKLVKEQDAPPPPPPTRGVSAGAVDTDIDVVKPTGGGDSFTARIKAAQQAKAGASR